MSYSHNHRKKAIKRKEWPKGAKTEKLRKMFAMIKERSTNVTISDTKTKTEN